MSHAGKIVNTITAILGALAIDYALTLDELVKNYVLYAIPALTVICKFILTMLSKAAGVKALDLLASDSSKQALELIKSQLDDPLIEEERKKSLRAQYNEIYDTMTDSKFNKFRVFTKAHSEAFNSAVDMSKSGVSDKEIEIINEDAKKLSAEHTSR